MVEFSGGCLCGAIRYEVKGDVVRTACCHCDDCRRSTGSAFATNIFVNADDLVILQGAPHTYQHTADSGNTMIKEFCADCGSQLFGATSRAPDLKYVKVGSIDDASFVKPEIEFYVSKALSFVHPSDETEHFEKGRGN
jgi:hypothetical protein